MPPSSATLRVFLFCCAAHCALPGQVHAQQADVERLVTMVLRRGDEGSVAHLGHELGPEGIAQCLEHGGRAARILCAQGARHLRRSFAVLLPLVAAMEDHDRHVASNAAQSVAAILSAFGRWDLGGQEALPSEVETLLRGLAAAARNEQLSVDVRALAVTSVGFLARTAGAAMELPRGLLEDPELAIQRAAVSALARSSETDDLEALTGVAESSSDLLMRAVATAGVCEMTALAGRPLPSPVEARARQLLGDPRARPSIIHPLFACIARAPRRHVEELRTLAAAHPNEASRQAWQNLTSPEDAGQ